MKIYHSLIKTTEIVEKKPLFYINAQKSLSLKPENRWVCINAYII